MRLAPDISVVMSVLDGASRLTESVRSVLRQDGPTMEFIIVDDGSTDSSPALLEGIAAQDHRVRVIRQDNRGLTRALIRGCAEARGRFIARQDCGDISLPGRFASQIRAIESNPEVALVSCGTRFVGPEGEHLYDVVVGPEDAMAGLLTLETKRLRGPSHHGATMFRRETYERVAGYRPQFYFAQDLDLWTRLVECGLHIAIPTVCYLASFDVNSISSLHRHRQIACAKVIIECARLRRAGLSQAAALEAAKDIVPDGRKRTSLDLAAALYFIGVCLQERGTPSARQYFMKALRACPFHLKSAVRLLLG